MMMNPQISSQVLIANTCPSILTEATTDGRLACNFGFLDSWSSPGRTPSRLHPQRHEIFVMASHLHGGEPGICKPVSTAPRMTKGRCTRPLRLKTIFHSQRRSAEARASQAGAGCRHCDLIPRFPATESSIAQCEYSRRNGQSIMEQAC